MSAPSYTSVVSGWIDLHCHWLPGVDDGVSSLQESILLLRSLAKLGFSRVVATPHMRPGLFDNRSGDLRVAFDEATASLESEAQLPVLSLACEHFFDEVVFARILAGEGLPYPGDRALLLEFYESRFPPTVDQLLARLVERGWLPVIAHPERYAALWRHPDVLERLLDVGAVALLDVGAVVGKYGQRPCQSARELLERGLYGAACSDAHRATDVEEVAAGIRWVENHYGPDEVTFLLREGPEAILRGESPLAD